jgi:hypothetical protein
MGTVSLEQEVATGVRYDCLASLPSDVFAVVEEVEEGKLVIKVYRQWTKNNALSEL